MECAPRSRRRSATRRRSGISRARLLGLTPVGVDLGADHQTERLAHLAAVLLSELDRLVAQLRRHIPRARMRPPFCARNIRYWVIPGSASRRRLGDQLGPDGAGFLVPVGSGELAARAVARASSSPPDRSLGRGRSHGRAGPVGCARYARRSSRRASRGWTRACSGSSSPARPASAPLPHTRIAVLAAASRAGHAMRARKEDVDPLRRARGPARPAHDCRGSRRHGNPSVVDRTNASRLSASGPDRAGLRGADRRLEQAPRLVVVSPAYDAVLGGCDAATVDAGRPRIRRSQP